ncbi:universal stress protein [Aequorivita capsosiphonis]|uniref:universal stress protein n=1 Tax=Aequorivita capsosiphonis TaxID=487317 RepID=UPI00040157ED|nr:universal stress protein [Aequorivita capsosiphonis]
MKNILLPTDFSQNAFNAMEYAVQLFQDEDCTFYLLNTYTPVAYNTSAYVNGQSAMMIEEITRKTSESELLEIEEKLKSKFKNSKHTFIRLSSFNLLVNEIIAVVKERNIDIIIMGTKGATGAKEVFLGTNTMFTIKKVTCPVIAIPDEFSYEKPKEILFPTDFKFSMENKSLKQLKSICTSHEARLNVLNIYFGESLSAKQEQLKSQFEQFIKDNNHIFHTEEYVDLVEAVERFQIKQKVNFLVMVQNKHSFFENLLFKPVVKQMVYHTNVPIMVMPAVE